MSAFFQSWKDSLSLFIPKNAKLFLLVTLKSILQSYKFILLHLGLLFALSAVLEMIYIRYFGPHSFFVIVPLLSWLITIFGIYLIIRPSIKRKGIEYYRNHIRYFFGFAFLTILFLFVCVASILFLRLLGTPAIIIRGIQIFFLLSDLVPFFACPLLCFIIFFYLDRPTHIKNLFLSCRRGVLMSAYNYPFCLTVYFFFIACSLGLHYGALLLGANSLIVSLLTNLLLPIPICIFNNFYVKRLHDQFDLYYPQNIKE